MGLFSGVFSRWKHAGEQQLGRYGAVMERGHGAGRSHLHSAYIGDGAVGFPDFLRFASQFGQSRDDAGFDARFDLDGDGEVGFSDFVIFARSFGNGT